MLVRDIPRMAVARTIGEGICYGVLYCESNRTDPVTKLGLSIIHSAFFPIFLCMALNYGTWKTFLQNLYARFKMQH